LCSDSIRIGHSLLALVLAVGGGRLSLWMFDREEGRRAGEPDGSTASAHGADVA